ncbi:unnamed protein product [Ectocarpus sp. 8 AP-2014]
MRGSYAQEWNGMPGRASCPGLSRRLYLALYCGVPACWWCFRRFSPTSREREIFCDNESCQMLLKVFGGCIHGVFLLRTTSSAGWFPSRPRSFFLSHRGGFLRVFHVASLASACSWLFNRCLGSWYVR